MSQKLNRSQNTWEPRENLNFNPKESNRKNRKKTKTRKQKKSSNNEDFVEKVLDKRDNDGKIEYLIKWYDYDNSYNSWEPAENLNFDPNEDNSANASQLENLMSVESHESKDSGNVDDEELIVERIEDIREVSGKKEYLIKWKGLDRFFSNFN